MSEDERITWRRPTPEEIDQLGSQGDTGHGSPVAERQQDAPVRARRLSPSLIVGLVALAVVAAALAGWLIRGSAGSSDAKAAAPGRSSAALTTPPAAGSTSATTSSPSATRTTSETTADPQRAALGDLDALVAEDSKGLVLDGHWVAQLASKTSGLFDPLDRPPSGGRTWTWSAIEQQHDSLRDDPRFAGDIRLVLSTSFGAAVTTKDGKPYYVTLYDGSFSSAADVRAWCAVQFAKLDKRHRDNSCVAARLSRPH